MTAVFLAAYFYIQSHPIRPPRQMPLTSLDSLIPFTPQLLVVYLSLWIFLGTGPGLQPNSRERLHYALWMGALGIVALFIFWVWPTRIPAVAVVAEAPGLRILHRVDLTSNACPSMHVASAIFTALRVDSVLRQTQASTYARFFNTAWFVAIAYSTVAIRQHVVLDGAAGALLGALFAVASLSAAGRGPAKSKRAHTTDVTVQSL